MRIVTAVSVALSIVQRNGDAPTALHVQMGEPGKTPGFTAMRRVPGDGAVVLAIHAPS